jgi:hypothetical protein
MPVLGISPCRILCDLPVYDFLGYPLGDLQGACDGCRFNPATSNEKFDLGRATGFRVNPNDDAYSAKSVRPVASFFSLPPHKPLFSVLSPVLPVPESLAKLLSGDSADDFQVVVSKEATFLWINT